MTFIKTSYNNIYPYISNIFYKYDKTCKILNFGSGDGLLSKKLFDVGYKNIVNCDIQNLSVDKTLPVILYDGKTLPFNDNTFDIVMINFVLHHIDYNKHIKIMKELKRVTKDIVIVSEDMTDTLADKIMGNIHIIVSNGWNSGDRANFRTSSELFALYKKLKLTVVKKIDISRLYSLIYPIKRTIFIVKKNYKNKTQDKSKDHSSK